jgi:hypothetical protein
MKHLYIVSALIEAGAALLLLVMPTAIQLVLGPGISGAAIPLARVAGAALLALAVACWFSRNEGKSRAARGLLVAMLTYNVGAASILGAAAIELHTAAMALWMAVIVHVAMCVWCASLLVGKTGRLD